MVESLISFAAVAAVVTVTPGLDTVLVLRTAAISGRGAALAAGAGIGVGCLCWATASALGLTGLLAASRLAFDALRWAGAAYLCWLGARALWRTRTRTRAAGEASIVDGDPPAGGRPAAAFRIGFVNNLLNPKVGVFYVSMLPQFLPAGVNPLLASIAMATVHNVEGMAWFVLLAFSVGRAAGLLTRPAVRRGLDRLTATVFIGFGVKLAVEGARGR
ncbi:MAG TPA: LysE family translocator [Micromonosporaceae bacterium]